MRRSHSMKAKEWTFDQYELQLKLLKGLSFAPIQGMEPGDSMKRNSMFKLLAIVSMMNVNASFSLAQTSGNSGAKTKPAGAGAAKPSSAAKPAAASTPKPASAVAPAASTPAAVGTQSSTNTNNATTAADAFAAGQEKVDEKKADAKRKENQDTMANQEFKDYKIRCEAFKKDAATAAANFKAACAQDEMTTPKSTTPPKTVDEAETRRAANTEKQKKINAQCGEELRTCRQRASAGETSLGVGMEMPMADFPEGSDTERRCSKYSETEWRSQVDKMETKLDTKNEAVQKLTEKQMEATRKATDETNDVMEEFRKAEEAKAQAEAESEESAATKEQEYQKAVQEYEKMMTNIDNEIFQLQQQQSIYVKRRGEEVDRYKEEVQVCRDKVEAKFGKMTPQVVSSFKTSGSTTAKFRKSVKTEWELCTNKALKNRINAADEYRSKMDMLERGIKLKMDEVNKTRESLARVKQSYEAALARQKTLKAKQEESFIKSQQSKIQKIGQLAEQIKTKTLDNAQAIAKANSAVTSVSQQLRSLKGEAPLGDKSLDEIKKEFEKYNVAQQMYEDYCDGPEGKILKARAEKAQGITPETPPSPAAK